MSYIHGFSYNWNLSRIYEIKVNINYRAWNHWHIKKTVFFALERGKSTTTSSAVVLGRYLRENFTMVQMQILWNTPSGSLATKNLFILESLQFNEGECLQLQPYKLEEFFHLAWSHHYGVRTKDLPNIKYLCGWIQLTIHIYLSI